MAGPNLANIETGCDIAELSGSLMACGSLVGSQPLYDNLAGLRFEHFELKDLVRRDNHADVYNIFIFRYYDGTSLWILEQQLRRQDPRLLLQARVYNFEQLPKSLLKARRRNLARLASRAIFEDSISTSLGQRTVIIYKVDTESEEGSKKKKSKGRGRRQSQARARERESNKERKRTGSKTIPYNGREALGLDSRATPFWKRPTPERRSVEFLARFLQAPLLPPSVTPAQRSYENLSKKYWQELWKLECNCAKWNQSLISKEKNHDRQRWNRSFLSGPCPFHSLFDSNDDIETRIREITLDVAFLKGMRDKLERLRLQSSSSHNYRLLALWNEDIPTETLRPLHIYKLFMRGESTISSTLTSAGLVQDYFVQQLCYVQFFEKLSSVEHTPNTSSTDKNMKMRGIEELQAILYRRPRRYWRGGRAFSLGNMAKIMGDEMESALLHLKKQAGVARNTRRHKFASGRNLYSGYPRKNRFMGKGQKFGGNRRETGGEVSFGSSPRDF